MSAPKYFHGGVPGLKVGAAILPSGETGASSLASYGGISRPDRVYVCTLEAGARLYAAGHPSGRGAVYEVRPEGELEADPDCNLPGLSWQCPRAVVVRVVPFSASARARTLRNLRSDLLAKGGRR